MKIYLCISIAFVLFLSGCKGLQQQPDDAYVGNKHQSFRDKLGEIEKVIPDLKSIHVILIDVWSSTTEQALSCGERVKQYWVDMGLEKNQIYIQGGSYVAGIRKGIMFAPPLLMNEKTMLSPGFVTITISGIHKDDSTIMSGKNVSLDFSLLEICS